jgi:hypothetical protein
MHFAFEMAALEFFLMKHGQRTLEVKKMMVSFPNSYKILFVIVIYKLLFTLQQ